MPLIIIPTLAKEMGSSWIEEYIFLIAQEDDLKNSESLLSGTSHEIKDRIKKITPQKLTDYINRSEYLDLILEFVL